MARNPLADFSGIDLNADSKKMLSALLARETFKPNPSLGGAVLNGLAMGLMGMFEKQDANANSAALDKFLLGSGTSPLPTSAPATVPSQPTPAAISSALRAEGADEVSQTTPQGYINRAWGGLTPEGGDIATRTVLGEASNQGQLGMQAVADVLRNRAAAGGFRTGSTGPTTMDRVALAPGQFEPHMTDAGRARIASYAPSSPLYQGAQAAVDAAAIGGQPDVTGGATHFYSPTAQAALGRQPPAWDNGTGRDIGGHRFFGGQAQPQQVAQAAINPVLNRAEQILRTPGASELEKNLARRILLQDKLREQKFEYKEMGGRLFQTDPSGRTQPREVTPGGEQGAIDFATKKERSVVGAREAAQQQAKVAATLPNDIRVAGSTVDEITKLIDHKGLPAIAGPIDQFRPSWAMGEAGRDALARFEQLKGRAFLQGYTVLKGGGPITQIEGEKAEKAMARMDRALSEASFKEALTDFRDAVRDGIAKLKQQAGIKDEPTSPQADPLGLR